MLTIITEDDWKVFCEDWGGTEANGILAEIESNNEDLVGSSEDVPISEEHINVLDESNGETRRPVIKTSPEVRFGFTLFPI